MNPGEKTGKDREMSTSTACYCNGSHRHPKCSRLHDFLKEPTEAGNRNAMLSDKASTGKKAIQETKDRMARQIEEIMKPLNN
ncbi:hypothetical protein F4780DRAFT_776438 [Xylariomycetidae sp. FL0641]|nr:hypothetical protein F4780DRAFT_776438 [Xylariomycetidae sp. FL0641]